MSRPNYTMKSEGIRLSEPTMCLCSWQNNISNETSKKGAGWHGSCSPSPHPRGQKWKDRRLIWRIRTISGLPGFGVPVTYPTIDPGMFAVANQTSPKHNEFSTFQSDDLASTAAIHQHQFVDLLAGNESQSFTAKWLADFKADGLVSRQRQNHLFEVYEMKGAVLGLGNSGWRWRSLFPGWSKLQPWKVGNLI